MLIKGAFVVFFVVACVPPGNLALESEQPLHVLFEDRQFMPLSSYRNSRLPKMVPRTASFDLEHSNMQTSIRNKKSFAENVLRLRHTNCECTTGSVE